MKQSETGRERERAKFSIRKPLKPAFHARGRFLRAWLEPFLWQLNAITRFAGSRSVWTVSTNPITLFGLYVFFPRRSRRDTRANVSFQPQLLAFESPPGVIPNFNCYLNRGNRFSGFEDGILWIVNSLPARVDKLPEFAWEKRDHTVSYDRNERICSENGPCFSLYKPIESGWKFMERHFGWRGEGKKWRRRVGTSKQRQLQIAINFAGLQITINFARKVRGKLSLKWQGAN